jgi:hypothetical protein
VNQALSYITDPSDPREERRQSLLPAGSRLAVPLDDPRKYARLDLQRELDNAAYHLGIARAAFNRARAAAAAQLGAEAESAGAFARATAEVLEVFEGGTRDIAEQAHRASLPRLVAVEGTGTEEGDDYA